MATRAGVVIDDMVVYVPHDGYPTYLGKVLEMSQPIDEWFFVRFARAFSRLYPDEWGLDWEYLYELKGNFFIIYDLRHYGKTKIGKIPVTVDWKNLKPRLILKDRENLAITVYSDDLPDLSSAQTVADAFKILIEHGIPTTPGARGDAPCRLL